MLSALVLTWAGSLAVALLAFVLVVAIQTVSGVLRRARPARPGQAPRVTPKQTPVAGAHGPSVLRATASTR